jgi:hypothetical protein
MTRSQLTLLSLAALAACSGGAKTNSATADSLSRDLSRPTTEATNALNDRPAAPAAPAHAAPKPKPHPKAPAAAAAPAAPSPRTLAAGTSIEATMSDSINSRHDKPGKVVTARVARDVKDRAGQVVIPAGSEVKLTVTALAPAENKSSKDGKLEFEVNSVNVNGRIYAVDADVDPVEHVLKGRGVTGGDVAKVGAGTAIGAIGGRLIGGSTKGAVIGGLIGAGAGTAVAVQTADRDVVVSPGAAVRLTLKGTLVASSN